MKTIRCFLPILLLSFFFSGQTYAQDEFAGQAQVEECNRIIDKLKCIPESEMKEKEKKVIKESIRELEKHRTKIARSISRPGLTRVSMGTHKAVLKSAARKVLPVLLKIAARATPGVGWLLCLWDAYNLLQPFLV